MANEQNLIPWKPGQSGNPAGKPKGIFNIKTLAKKMLEDMDTWNRLPVSKDQIQKIREQIGHDKNFGQALIFMWMSKGMTDAKFATIVQELVDGKGKQEIELDTTDSLFNTKKLIIEEKKPDFDDRPNDQPDAKPETAPSDQATTESDNS